MKFKKKTLEDETLGFNWVSHGTSNYICTYINAAANSVTLQL